MGLFFCDGLSLCLLLILVCQSFSLCLHNIVRSFVFASTTYYFCIRVFTSQQTNAACSAWIKHMTVHTWTVLRNNVSFRKEFHYSFFWERKLHFLEGAIIFSRIIYLYPTIHLNYTHLVLSPNLRDPLAYDVFFSQKTIYVADVSANIFVAISTNISIQSLLSTSSNISALFFYHLVTMSSMSCMVIRIGWWLRNLLKRSQSCT